jgi:16S rRNA (uracil1498-N3)-methyltransferase
MPERFYAPVPYDQPTVELTGSEAHHLRDVLRLGVGEEVLLFDGRGVEARAEITAIGKRAIAIKVLQTRTIDAGRLAPVILATAVPKGDRFRWLVEKATELGVAELIPLSTRHSVVLPRDAKLEKMRQTVIAASKQCGRARLMQIDSPMTWEEFVSRRCADCTLLVAHPSGLPLAAAPVDSSSSRPIIAAIGPEGGFTDTEVELAVAAGARVVSLGEGILRIETAAIALSALLLCSGTGEYRAPLGDEGD